MKNTDRPVFGAGAPTRADGGGAVGETVVDPRASAGFLDTMPSGDFPAVPMRHPHGSEVGPKDAGEPPVNFETLLAPGARVRQYEIIRELGRGGMGSVYLARDTRLGRLVAMKFLLGGSAQFTERFLVEARTTARCNHENIVVIHEVDEHAGFPYMVLEYLEGEPLSAIVGNNRLPPRRAISLMIPVARALVRAHEFNIVHRDLKPDNIFLTNSGQIKVLDFGIAKLFGDDEDAASDIEPSELEKLDSDSAARKLTREGAIIGTLPYMSPEQFGVAEVDHRTDLWAFGITMHEMVTGKHPLDPINPHRLHYAALMMDEPMPSVAQAAHDLPGGLERLIDRCLAKDKERRIGSARELLTELEQLTPEHYGRTLVVGESPFPGLTAFQEGDASRFFGRSREVVRAVVRLRDQPLLGVVGPSGVGKSSLVRAGIVPALKSSGDDWEVFTIRPGRDPLAALASVLQPLTTSSSGDLTTKMHEHASLVKRLREEPGYLGTLLRSRARQKNCEILLFVDQFEELYTLVPDAAERACFTACLAGVADDSATPLRVVVAMRSDLLDRAAEDTRFVEELTRGLVFLTPPNRDGLRDALIQPVEMVGYAFESEAMIDSMLDALASTQGALPLLQFTAAQLWDHRDRERRVLSEASYINLGGVGGALASHANQVLAGLGAPAQRLVRAIFQNLVTPDRTRAIVDVADLRGLGDGGEVDRLVQRLADARLLVMQTRDDSASAAVEIVHESLITGWPTLRKWLDEGHEDAAFREQLRQAAKQWDAKGRPTGLLWRGESAVETRRWHERFTGELPVRERDFVFEVLALAARSTRRRRGLVVAALVVLTGLVVAALVGMFVIRKAERAANDQRDVAETKTRKLEHTNAELKRQMKLVQSATLAKQRAQDQVTKIEGERTQDKKALEVAKRTVKRADTKLAEKNAALVKALRAAQDATKRAEALAAKEKKARGELKRLLDIERDRVKKWKQRSRDINTKLR